MAESIKKLEVDGIEVEFDKSKLSDMRFVTMLGDIEDDSLDDGEKLIVQSRLLRFIFGRAQRDRIQDELAEKADDNLANEAFSVWWVEFLKAANAKN